MVVLLLIAAVLVVLARVRVWQQAFVSARMIRFFAWVLAAIFLFEMLAAFTWSREHEWYVDRHEPEAIDAESGEVVLDISGAELPARSGRGRSVHR